MLYKNIRSCRHLYNEAKEKPVRFFFSTISDSYVYDGCAVSIQDEENPDKKYLVIFNRFFNDAYCGNVNLFGKIDKTLFNEYGNYCLFDVELYGNSCEYSNRFNYVCAVSNNINEEYNNFLKSNNKMILPVCKKLAIDLNSSLSKYLYVITNASGNFFAWALNQVYGRQRPSWLIRQIMLWYNKYGRLSSELRKKTITAYVSFSDIVTLMDEMSHIKMVKRANDTINMFNTAQKRILKNADKSDEEINILNRFNVLSNEKKINFIRKMSTVDDYNEIIKEMSHLIKVHFKWDKESFLDYINNTDNLNYDIIKEGDKFFVIEVKDYETIKRFTKSTNWCISKNKKYWNDYVEYKKDARQFIILDFGKKEDDADSIIGFTVRNGDGVTNAHNFFNLDLINRRNECGTLVSLMEPYEKNCSIFTILDKYGIDISNLIGKKLFMFDFTRNGFISFIESVIGKNYHIISDNDNKLVVMINDKNVGDLFGNSYYTMCRREYVDCKHIVFLDFNNKEKDRMYVSIIVRDGYEEEVCSLFDENFKRVRNCKFDLLLCEYGLPYDVICRTNDNIVKIAEYMSEFDHITLNKLLSDESVKKDIKNYAKNKGNIMDDRFIYDILSHSVFNGCSTDMLTVFYNNGIKLCDLFTNKKFVSLLVKSILSKMVQRRNTIPTDSELKRFYEGKLNIDEAYSIMFYIAVNTIINNETDLSIFNDSMNYFTSNEIIRYLVHNVIKKSTESDYDNHIVKTSINCIFKLSWLEDERKYVYEKFHNRMSESQSF